jgi:hypothetical protein
MTESQIKEFARKHLFHGYDFVTTEMGPYHSVIRFDVLGLRRSKRIVRILEAKTSRADFLADKKWRKYLAYATFFYFVAPVGVIKPEELDDRIGLIELRPVTNSEKYLRYEYVKKCRKLPDISVGCYIQLIEAVAWRQWRAGVAG